MITLSHEDHQIVSGAVDSLALALSQHAHVWTEGEKTIYEEACKVLVLVSDVEAHHEATADTCAFYHHPLVKRCRRAEQAITAFAMKCGT